MRDARVLGVIPARIGSERLPRKPLVTIAGRPLIEWVWRRARALPSLDAVIVATDSEEVASVAHAAGADVRLTSAAHESGTARVAEVAADSGLAGYDIIVNVQGDEPFIGDDAVAGAVGRVAAGDDIGTAAAAVRTMAAWTDPSVVKVVRDDAGRALYFSRAPIPCRRGGRPSDSELASDRYLRHVGVYAYSPDALARWVALPPSRLEASERLEQLRPLAAGMSIGVAVIEEAAEGIDTDEDVRRAERRLGRSVNAETITGT